MDKIRPAIHTESPKLPFLPFDDLAIPLAAAIPRIQLPTTTRFPSHSKPTKRNPRRPSTASSAEEKITLLPSSPFSLDQSPLLLPQVTTLSEFDQMAFHGSRPDKSPPPDTSPLDPVTRRAHVAVAGHRADASRLGGAADVLPSPFDAYPSDDQLFQTVSSLEPIDEQSDYDWAVFIRAYSLGRWDPLKTPHPPRSTLHVPAHGPPSSSTAQSQPTDPLVPLEQPSDTSEADDWVPDEIIQPPSLPSGYEDVVNVGVDGFTLSAPPQYHVPSAVSTIKATYIPSLLPDTGISKLSDRRTSMPLHLGGLNRTRNSLADLRSPSSAPTLADPSRPPHTDVTTSAAAIRWAAAHVSVAPLALPSPEHELTDPMRGVTATIPGSHPPDHYVRPDPAPTSPSGIRKSRLSSFWQGTQDIEDPRSPSMVSTPPEPDGLKSDPGHERERKKMARSMPLISTSVVPATAPVRVSIEQEDDGYFGSVDGAAYDSVATVSDWPSFATEASGTPPRPDVDVLRQSSAPLLVHEAATVPALPRRICLTRQTSAPLPTLALYERRIRSTRPSSDGLLPSVAVRAAKEEQMYNELGYLTPPNPPDELERRRALYKFNIWNTGHDMNFDRIVHLVKLVFNTRIVVISLVDGTEIFLKSESGFSQQNLPRTSSFDAHALLQREDEPTVVLDACEDWRFAKNPLVTGPPGIRFYAGCPLRTQDGFNIGTLSIIDDSPRREFSPRQRHTLKEFAQIAMRELELWRDKIQLRIRDRIQSSMEQFTRECLEVDNDPEGADKKVGIFSGASMEQIYESAAKLVKRTLDVEGAIVLDVSHADVLESFGAESSTSINMHSADEQPGTMTRPLCAEEHAKLQEFFEKFPHGKISEGLAPAALRCFLPSRIQYALSVPIFNIDKRPFAVLCAYSTGERTTPFLEGHELSYLRAIGVIILSAVLKRRMILADKAKSLFISNISHELRTPLHGILASAELLSETQLDHSQASFLQTVQACGMSLVETVNHVLDFTKLSGNAKAGGVENIIQRSKVDLMQLVEEATEGCWIGHRARMFTSEIGSVYSPPKQDRQALVVSSLPRQVETVIDFAHNERGWTVKCERGGIRRVLMNVFGNSLKFTSDGYVHVMLRQLPPVGDQPSNTVKIELSVIDTGKGISQSFLKDQLFHPFSQENPLQTGTGLGLAIVHSIVRSSSVDGKVDVWSAEGVGTEIKVTFTAETVESDEASAGDQELIKLYHSLKSPAISLVGFDNPHKGVRLLRDVLSSYLVARWGFTIAPEGGKELGSIVVINEDYAPVAKAIEENDITRSFVVLSSRRGEGRLMSLVTDYEHIGGFARIVYKPVGPCRLFAVLKLCLHAMNIAENSRVKGMVGQYTSNGILDGAFVKETEGRDLFFGQIPRRFSDEGGMKPYPPRPTMAPRAITTHPLTTWSHTSSGDEQEHSDRESPPDSAVFAQSPSSPTIAVGNGGTLLKSAVRDAEQAGRIRVLVVEDNTILRNLLIKWLKNKGHDYRDAVDGLDGVRVFEDEDPFDVVLVDLSMPVLDGVGATAKMREIEAARRHATQNSDQRNPRRARILALTGMSSLEDKRRAFEAGVDGYLVKPVGFKTLDSMFHKLGFS